MPPHSPYQVQFCHKIFNYDRAPEKHISKNKDRDIPHKPLHNEAQ